MSKKTKRENNSSFFQTKQFFEREPAKFFCMTDLYFVYFVAELLVPVFLNNSVVDTHMVPTYKKNH